MAVGIRQYQAYLPQHIEALRFESDEQAEQVMGEVRELAIFEDDNGQRISGIHANRNEFSEPPLVRVNSMFGASDRLDQQYIVTQAAIKFPRRGIIQFDLPAHGESDPLTPEQAKEIRDEGTTALIGLSRAQALRNRLPELSAFDVYGEAAGGRVAADMAAQAEKSDLVVGSFIGIDMVGLEDRSTPAMAASYFRSIIRRRLFGSKLGSDEHLVAAFEDFKEQAAQFEMTKETTIRREAEVFKKGTGYSGYLLKNSPLAKGGGAEALEKALHDNPEMQAYLLFAGQSAMGRSEKALPALDQLLTGFPGRVTITEWPYDDQNIGLAPQHPRLNRFIGHALES